MIEFQNVSKVFTSKTKEVTALKDVDLTVNKGDIFGVIGFSGAGKSTLVRTVNLLEKPTSGKVLVNGENLATLPKKQLRQAQKGIGMIFQHFHLLNSKTVYDNVAMPLLLSKVKKPEIEKRVKETLDFVGLGDKIDNYPDQLSGGQKQRVGIARALVTNPSVLLCDEATSALDPQTTVSILNLLKKVNEAYNITVLIITHEMEVIKEVCNRVAVMEDGEVIEHGTVLDVFTNPQTETTYNFVKSIVRDEIPQSVYRQLEAAQYNGRVFQFKFLGVSSGKPVISQIAKRFQVEVNVLSANVIELGDIPFGNLLLELIGSNEEIEKALQFASDEQVTMKEVMRDGSRIRYYSKGSLGNVAHG